MDYNDDDDDNEMEILQRKMKMIIETTECIRALNQY